MGNILTMAVNDIIALVESKEMAGNAIPPYDVYVASTFRSQKATTVSKNCRSSHYPSPGNPSKRSLYPYVRNNFTCVEKAIVGETPNRSLYVTIASVHVARTK